jgi:acyl dehydratase
MTSRDLARSWTVSREDLVRYAGASLDFNDIHLDPQAAALAGYDDAIAHGMLGLGRLLVHVVETVGPISACRGRFAAPSLVGRPVAVRTVSEIPGRLGLSLDDVESGSCVLSLEVDLGGTARAESVEGELVADRVLTVERGPAVRFAAAVEAADAGWTDPRAGLEPTEALAVVPTFAFALPGWGWFPELQPNDGSRPDPVLDCRAWTGTDGAVIHAAQDFAYHRPLRVGHVVRSRSYVVRRFRKEGGSGALDFTVVAQRLTDEQDVPVVTSTMTLIVKEDERVGR